MSGDRAVRLGYLAFLATMPLGDVAPPGGPAWLTPTKAGFLVLLAAAGWAALRGWRPPRLPLLERSLVLLAAGGAVSTLFSLHPATSRAFLPRMAALALLCLLTAWVAARGGTRAVLAGLFAVSLPLGLLALYQTLAGRTVLGLGIYGDFGRLIDIWFPGGGEGLSVVRASATFDHPNLFAALLLAAVPAGLAAAAGRRSRVAPFAATGTVLLLAALVYTFSRGAMLGLLAGMAVLLFPGGVRRRAVLLVACSLLGAILLLPPPARLVFWTRAGTVQTYDTGRLYSWSAALRMAAARPLAGTGPGTFDRVYRDYDRPGETWRQNPLHRMDAHNTFLDLLAEGGLAMLLPFLLALAAAVHGLRRSNREEADGPGEVKLVSRTVAAALAGVLVQSFFNSLEYQEILWILLGLASAGGPALKVKER